MLRSYMNRIPSHFIFLDEILNLDNLLIQVRDEATIVWYELGEALGVEKEVLEECSRYPQEDSIVEMLDYWLKKSGSRPTWRHVGSALKNIGLEELGERILNVYRHGL